MKFATSKKLLIEDFPEEQRSWLTKLIDPINGFLEKTSQALTQGLVLADNSKALVTSVSVVASQTYPMKLNISSLKQRPASVTIGKLAITDGTTPADPYSVYWTYDEGVLNYTFLGLDNAKAYTITLIIQC